MTGMSATIRARGQKFLRAAERQASLPFDRTAFKAVVKRATRALGYEVISRKRAGGRQLAIHLEELFCRLEIDCIFDVGANRGQYRNFLRQELGYRGPIVSFEPIPENVEYLNQQARSDPLWII